MLSNPKQMSIPKAESQSSTLSPKKGRTLVISSFFFVLAVFGAAPSTANAFILSKSFNNLLGLVGWWTFDGKDMTNGIALDRSGSNNNGNLFNIATSTFYTAGKIGQALSFDGADDAASAAINLSALNKVTVSFWLNWAVNGTDDDLALEYTNNFNGKNGFIVDPNDPVNFGVFMSNTAGYNGGKFTKPTAGVWHHYAIVFDRSVTGGGALGVIAYVDAVSQTLGTLSSGDLSASNYDNASLFFMSRGASSLFGKGLLDDVRLYNRALSASEITQLYNQGQSKQNASKNTFLTSGLVGLWSFDGKDTVGGLIYDRSGNNNHGGAVNIATSTFYVPGKIGQALRFFGGNDLINLPNSSVFNPGGAFSACGWVYSKVEGQAARAVISQTDSADKATYKWIAGYVTTNSAALQSYVRIGGAVSNVSKSLALANSWHHFCSTFDRTLSSARLKIYVDGVLGDSVNATDGDIDSGDYPTIADWGATGASFIGKIDDVRLYSRALSASEITQLYNQGQSKQNASRNTFLTSGLVGLWSFDGKDTVGGLIYDRSGNNNHGGAVNIATSTFYVPGKIGQALNFDGTDDTVSIPITASIKGLSSASASGWIKPSTLRTGNIYYESINSINTSARLRLGTNATGFLSCVVRIPDTTVVTIITSLAPANVWTHFVCTVDVINNLINTYVNGVLISSDVQSFTQTTFDNTDPAGISIGSTPAGATLAKGGIDDVRVYGRALSASEVLQLYNLGR